MNTGIVGSDGIVPIYEPDGAWKIWALQEIFTGTVGQGKYVPKVRDYVIDYTTDERYYVESVDPTTLVSVLKKIKPAIVTDDFDDSDILLGVGPGTQSDTYRVYLDQSVLPHTLAVDARLKVNGTMVATAKIFKGSELVGDQKVISAFYDAGGVMLGQAIPLELVAMPNHQNYAVKSVPVCYTTEKLADGEIVTVVFYSNTGHVVSKRQLLVENTAFIRSSDSETKYVTTISLESPFLSDSDPSLIQYPLNVPLRGLNLMGVVHYSDGSTKKMPVDGTKFAIFGFESFVATVIGQKVPLVLRYTLSAGEIAYGATVGAEKYMTKTMKAITVKADGAYTVKLFGYPVWIDAINGYRLEWFLYNLDRQTVYRATPYVRINENTRAFDPIAYGINQKLSVSVNLKEVNGSYTSYIHTQTIDIVLAKPGDERDTNWTIQFAPGQSPAYGRDNFAKSYFVNTNLMRIDLDMDLADDKKVEWLDRLYYRSLPLVDPEREINPPEPNFFSLVVGGVDIEFPISQWNQELVVNSVIDNNDTLFVKFFKRTADNDLHLAVAALPVYQQN